MGEESAFGVSKDRDEQRLQRFTERKRQWEQATAAMIEALPEDYRLAVDELQSMSYDFRDAISKCLEPRLNWTLKRQPDATYGDKRKLGSWVNRELTDLGLTLYDVPSQEPVILTAEKGHDGRGSLHYETRVEPSGYSNVEPYRKLQAFDSVPEVNLRAADLCRPQWDKWINRALENRSRDRER